MDVISKSEAKDLGAPTYYTGKPCNRGHVDLRRTDNSTCLSCIKERNKEFYSDNREREKKRTSDYVKQNKELCNAARRKHLEKNRDKMNTRARKYYSKNSVKINAANKAWASRNINKVKLAAKDYRDKNKDLLKQRDAAKYLKRKDTIKIWSKKYRSENLESIVARQKRWRAENKDMVKASRWRRKARLRNAEGRFTGEDVSNLMILQKSCCTACLKNIASGYEIDHIMPLYLGGSNNADNIQLLCRTCNRSKWAKHPIDWAQENGRLL